MPLAAGAGTAYQEAIGNLPPGSDAAKMIRGINAGATLGDMWTAAEGAPEGYEVAAAAAAGSGNWVAGEFVAGLTLLGGMSPLPGGALLGLGIGMFLAPRVEAYITDDLNNTYGVTDAILKEQQIATNARLKWVEEGRKSFLSSAVDGLFKGEYEFNDNKELVAIRYVNEETGYHCEFKDGKVTVFDNWLNPISQADFDLVMYDSVILDFLNDAKESLQDFLDANNANVDIDEQVAAIDIKNEDVSTVDGEEMQALVAKDAAIRNNGESFKAVENDYVKVY